MAAKTALVVDDSKSARFALRKFLENHGYKVDTAESAEVAFDFLKGHQPDVIFLDHIMPGIDGFEALRHIKNDPATGFIPAVICSSNEGEAFNQEAQGQGAAAVLQKPPSPEQLTRVLESLQKITVQRPSPVAVAPAPPPPLPPELMIPPSPPPKVTNIREPDVAIEQAVMKALRSAMPTRPESAAPEAFKPGAYGAAAQGFNPAATGSFNPAAAGVRDPGLREQIDERIRKVTQDLFVHVAALKADLTQTEDRLEAIGHPPSEDQIREIAQEELFAVRSRIEALDQAFTNQLHELRAQIEAGFAAQAQRLEQLAQSARQAAAEEAHAVAERAVMSAASRISDQLADSILHAFRTPKRRSEL